MVIDDATLLFFHAIIAMVGPPIRNAKARKSASRKKGKKQQHPIHQNEDTNIDILIPKSSEDKDKQRKEQLLQEVFESFCVPWHLNKALSAYFPNGSYVDYQEEKETGEIYRTVP